MLNVFLEGGPTSATSCLPSPSAGVSDRPQTARRSCCPLLCLSSGRSEMQAFQAQRLAAFWAALLVPRALW